MTERERGFAKWADSVPKCIGYPTCDGDLVGTVHEDECPMSKVENSAGKAFAATYYDCWQAAFEAGRGGWISVDVRLPAEREKVLIVHAAAPDNMHYPKVDVEMAFMADGEWYDAGDTRNMGAFNNETWSIEFWQPLPAPPDSGDAKEDERG